MFFVANIVVIDVDVDLFFITIIDVTWMLFDNSIIYLANPLYRLIIKNHISLTN